jgi:hypothetical protein
MNYIKEPKGIDFLIESGPITAEFQEEVTKLIREYRKRTKRSVSNKKSGSKSEKVNRKNVA